MTRSNFFLALTVFLVASRSHALSIQVMPRHDDQGRITVVQPMADGGFLDFGPVALFNGVPRTGTLTTTSWGFWLLATFELQISGARGATSVFAHTFPIPGTRVRWSAGTTRTDWGPDGFGIDIVGADRRVAEGRVVSGPHQIGFGMEDAGGGGPRDPLIFISVLEE